MRLIGVLVLACLAVTQTARAESFWDDSLEWMVAEATWVGTGTIVKSETRQFGQSQHLVMTLRVDETIKGKAGRELEFVWYSLAGEGSPGGRVLLFLRTPEGGTGIGGDLPKDWLLLSGSFPTPRGLVMGPNMEPIYTMDQRTLTDPDETVKAARAAAADVPLRPGSIQLMLSPRGMMSDYWGLRVPVTPRLEAMARQWARAPDHYESAIYALGQFKTPGATEFLRSLLTSRDYPRRFNSVEGPDAAGWLKVAYPVRQAAREALRQAGESGPWPAGHEPLYDYPPVGWRWVWATVPAVLVLALVWFTRRWGRAGPGTLLWRMAWGLSLAIALMLALILIRGKWREDAFIATTRDAEHVVVVGRGAVEYLAIDDQPPVRSVRHASALRTNTPEFAYGALVTPASVKQALGLTLGQGSVIGTSVTYPCRMLAMPLWSLIVIAGLLPAMAGILRMRWALRQHRRARLGLCLECGYDLRATPGRCPECGKETVK